MSDAEEVAGKTPGGLPGYRLLTGPDDAAFCWRVSEALDLGWGLFGDPAIAVDPSGRVTVAQALLWPIVLASVETA
jgi:hypothetical protein